MPNTTNTITTAGGRSMEEITASVRIHMRNMVNNALEIGMDLTEAKEACRHGEWIPWLKSVGISASTAANYMRVAREVSADSRMAQLPYTKILALLNAPPEEREELAEAAEDMSAAEIRRLTEERNRAAEAANAETARADHAEADAKQFSQDNAALRVKMQTLQEKLKEYEKSHDYQCKEIKNAWNAFHEEKERSEKLKADLLTAENNRIEVEKVVEVVPEDYEELKRQKQELLDAAAEAEERANDAEAELEALRASGSGQPEPAWKILKVAMTRFMTDVEMMPLDPAALVPEKSRILANVSRLEKWTDMMRMALAGVVPAEGAVV